MRLKQWPKPVTHGQFTSSKAGGGRRLAGLMREQTLRVDPEETLSCPPPRGQIGTRLFYGVTEEPNLWVAYVHADAEEMDRLRFVFVRGTRAITFSPDTVRALVVGEDKRSLTLVLREQGDGADDESALGVEATPGGLPPAAEAAAPAVPALTPVVALAPAEAATDVGADDDDATSASAAAPGEGEGGT